MLILRRKDNLLNEFINFIQDCKSLILIAPYIKLDPLKRLIKSTSKGSRKTIITSWRSRDIALKVSDISVYLYCRDNDIPLLINNNIHLKTLIRNDFGSWIISSANITNKGLGISEDYNYELGTILETINLEDKLYIDKIIMESFPVNDRYYEEIRKKSEEIEIEEQIQEDFDIELPVNY